jgi:hypothetical protein
MPTPTELWGRCSVCRPEFPVSHTQYLSAFLEVFLFRHAAQVVERVASALYNLIYEGLR